VGISRVLAGTADIFGYPLLSQEFVKLRTSNFVRTFIGSIGTKAHEKFWQSSRGRSQGVPIILVASCGRYIFRNFIRRRRRRRRVDVRAHSSGSCLYAQKAMKISRE